MPTVVGDVEMAVPSSEQGRPNLGQPFGHLGDTPRRQSAGSQDVAPTWLSWALPAVRRSAPPEP